MTGEPLLDARLGEIVEQYGRLIGSVVGRLMRGRMAHAEDDVRQEVVIALWKRLQNEAPIAHPTSYVSQVARREAIRVLQREARRYGEVNEVTEAPARPEDGPLGRLERLELGEKINRAIGSLAIDRQRAVRAHLMGFDVQEIMRMHGWPYQTARNLVTRGMADLREILSDQPDKEASK